jgi:signal recognition particle subunit SRP54
VKAVTGKPIKFVGMGEQLDRLEEFHPERMASRILGMGDVVSLVEKAQDAVDAEQAQVLAEKIRRNALTLDDFLHQLRQVRKMGPLKELIAMIPGLNRLDFGDAQSELPRIEAMICSMTPQEREDPDIIDGSRRRRIAVGSGADPIAVNSLLKQFKQMKKVMRHLAVPRSGELAVGPAGGMGGALGMAVPRTRGLIGRQHRRRRK